MGTACYHLMEGKHLVERDSSWDMHLIVGEGIQSHLKDTRSVVAGVYQVLSHTGVRFQKWVDILLRFVAVRQQKVVVVEDTHWVVVVRNQLAVADRLAVVNYTPVVELDNRGFEEDRDCLSSMDSLAHLLVVLGVGDTLLAAAADLA